MKFSHESGALEQTPRVSQTLNLSEDQEDDEKENDEDTMHVDEPFSLLRTATGYNIPLGPHTRQKQQLDGESQKPITHGSPIKPVAVPIIIEDTSADEEALPLNLSMQHVTAYSKPVCSILRFGNFPAYPIYPNRRYPNSKLLQGGLVREVEALGLWRILLNQQFPERAGLRWSRRKAAPARPLNQPSPNALLAK